MAIQRFNLREMIEHWGCVLKSGNREIDRGNECRVLSLLVIKCQMTLLSALSSKGLEGGLRLYYLG